jgi:glucose-1-phosphate thymidylyltransferase
VDLTGVILAAGVGSRMQPYAPGPKASLPVCNQPLVDHQLAIFARLGIRQVVVVVGHLGDQVAQVVRVGCPAEIELRFVEQPAPRGIADALWQARDYVGARMVVVLGDTYLVAGDLHAGLRGLEEQNDRPTAAVLSIRREPSAARIRQECTVRFDAGGSLERIEEKPTRPFNDLKPCGLYFFAPAIFEAIARTPPSALRGEVEITDALQLLVDSGYRVGRAAAVLWDRNLNTPADLLACNLAELRRRHLQVLLHPDAHVDASAVLHNVVVGDQGRIGPESRLTNVVLLPEASVGSAQSLSDALVTPGGVFTQRPAAEASSNSPVT